MVLLNTDQGERVTLNRTNGEMKFQHRTGTTILILSDGSIRIETKQPETIYGGSVDTTMPETEVSIAGKLKVTVDKGGIDLTANQSTVNINANGGDVNLGSNACDKIVNGQVIKSKTKHPINNFTNCLFTGAPHCAPDALAAVAGEMNVFV